MHQAGGPFLFVAEALERRSSLLSSPHSLNSLYVRHLSAWAVIILINICNGFWVASYCILESRRLLAVGCLIVYFLRRRWTLTP